MIIKRTVKGSFYFFLFVNQLLIGAEDFEFRNTISFKYKLPYSLRLDVEQSLRSRSEKLKFRQTFSEFTISYKLFENAKVFIPLRYAFFEDKIKKRISFGCSYKYKINKLIARYKSRYQAGYEEGENTEEVFRNKLYLYYKFNKKLTPFFSYEIFHPFSSDNTNMNEYRLTYGSDIDLPWKKTLKIYYQYKIDKLNKSDPDVMNVIGLTLSLN